MDAYERTHPVVSTTFRFNDPDGERRSPLGSLRRFRDYRRTAA